MKLGRVLALAALVASLPAHAFQDFDACFAAPMQGSAGTVESVRLVSLPRDLHAFDPEVLSHGVRPETAEELAVRLDAGPLVVFTRREPHRLQAGQRVRVQLNGSTASVERESGLCAIPLARHDRNAAIM
jgi:hypothetical protein